MSKPILFYDIPDKAWSGQSWSPNTWRTKICLNIKGLPFKTVYVEYPDIARVCKEIGAEPTDTRDGEPLYTLPVIQDPNTGAVISDSYNIAQYLDEKYPTTPQLIPPGTEAFQRMFVSVYGQKTRGPIYKLIVVPVCNQLPPRSAQYFRETRTKALQMSLEDFAPKPGQETEEMWKALRTVYSQVHSWLSANGEDKLYFMGDKPVWADAVLLSALLWLRVIPGLEDLKEWKELLAADGGRWGRLLQASENLTKGGESA
ncbi:hypothetical protein DENSPDRAFT_832462 [Dentipellis sp. KUC8613]|nr:hypothetical protein DENSPDRAFT_832462 [Dentipellis sp. KUC8613]